MIKKSDYILRNTVYKEKNDIHTDQKLRRFGIDGNIYFLASTTQEYQVSVHIEQYPSSATVSNHNIVKCCNTSFILKSFLASDDFYRLLMVFANSLDPDLGPNFNCLNLKC